jgi:oxygen-independent coproporphyrinogen-3 oxidase
MELYMAGEGGEVTFIDEEEAAEEAVFLGLRMNEGVAQEMLRGLNFEEMVRDGLLRRDEGRVMLTERGRIVSNEVFGELLRTLV